MTESHGGETCDNFPDSGNVAQVLRLFPPPAEEVEEESPAFVLPDAAGDLAAVVEVGVLEEVDEAAGGAAFRIVTAEDNAADAAMDDGACAHGAWFFGDIEVAIGEAPVLHGAFGLGEGEHFRVSGGVLERLHLVPCAANDVAFPDNDGADGNFVESRGLLREAQSFVHEVGIERGINEHWQSRGVVFGVDHGAANERARRAGARILPGAAGKAVKGSRSMTQTDDNFTAVAIDAARQAGALIKVNFGGVLGVNELNQYDIKLELDVRAQELITAIVLRSFPDHAIYGEEGLAGNQASDHQWIVDPIDGTVNYFYGIPHFCVSIALRVAGEIVLGVIYDPMQDELFLGRKGEVPTLNGQPIKVSTRAELADAMITVGFSKNRESIDAGLQRFKELLFKVRKTRMLGSAALGMAYVAAGRLDAYLEEVISLWDVAAGIILVETAGGRARMFEKDAAAEKYSMCATNGLLPLGWVEEEMQAAAKP